MFFFKCFKCKGQMRLEEGPQGAYCHCLQCGHKQPVPLK